jgi:triacylglycerol lipase
MRKGPLFILLGFIAGTGFASSSEPRLWVRGKTECVILLHGIGRSPRSLSRLEARLSSEGYRVFNLGYPSTKYPIEYLAEEILHPLIERVNADCPARIHFVTHSMGGIVARYYLQHHDLPNLGRVVMLSPPNEGSRLVDFLKRSILFKKFMAPAGRQLGTDKDSLPRRLGAAHFEVGIIAGNKSDNPINSWILDGADDGAVSVESTRLLGMKDFIVLRCSHRSILRNREALDQVLHFLKFGAFRHEPGR